MRVIRLQAENFKILKAIDITPGGGPVVIGGRNEQGKSSVMDAIWVALSGRSAAPPKPVRSGEDKATITLDVGEYLVHRTFTDKGDGTYTDTLKLTDERGRIVPKAQSVLNDMLGAVGFDPFEFTKRKPEDQADQLLQLVPLPIDLEEFASEDATDYATRRDRNREVERLDAQIAGLTQHDIPADAPDRNVLADQLANAAQTNSAIDTERRDREDTARVAAGRRTHAQQLRDGAEQQRRNAEAALAEAERLENSAKADDADAERLDRELAALPALDEPVDTAALRQRMAEADAIEAKRTSNARRAALVEQRVALAAEVEGYTTALNDRERQRRDALAKAKMPVDGLGFAVNEKGKPVVTFNGLPFSQASTAAQIRASTAIAMAANPDLRILRIKDGSLLDEDTLATVAAMAADEDFQLWVEVVGEGAAGIIIENGEIRADKASNGGDAPLAATEAGGTDSAPQENPTKSKKGKAAGQGGLL